MYTTPHPQVSRRLIGRKLIGKFLGYNPPRIESINKFRSMKKELARLERNKDRRLAREKAKERQSGGKHAAAGDGDAGSPSSNPLPSTERPTGTTRKCANCGQTGHIKTNKKYVKPTTAATVNQRDHRKTLANGILNW